MKAYLDSTAILDVLEPMSSRYATARSTLTTTGRVWATSDLVRLECLVRPFRARDIQAEGDVRRLLLGMDLLTMSPAVFDAAAQFRADLGLKTPDALHLATAIHHGCDEFWTNDERLIRSGASIAFRSF